MPLPKITTPTFELELPSTEKTIKYRPFLVREEKILILALESQDNKQITNAIKQILKECILTRGVKIEDLPTFDIEYIFLNVRGKSIGESIDLIVTCPDDNQTEVPITVYIDNIKIEKNPDHNKDIQLGSNLILRMKYPSLDQFIKNNFDFSDNKSISNIDKSFDIITSCVDMIFNDEDTWAGNDCTKKELIDFIEGMNSLQFKMIEKFFETMPKLIHTIKVLNPNTNVESDITLEGLTSFFG